MGALHLFLKNHQIAARTAKSKARDMSDIVQKLWGFCHTLRHEGIDYGDYIEQITYLLFLKMADEREIKLPDACDWQSLKKMSGTELTEHYNDALRTLGKQEELLGDIF